MSRPFSYNDENFTVIGNVLFVHIIDNKARKSSEPVVEIPPAIFERMESYANSCIATYKDINDLDDNAVTNISILNSDNKHYLTFGSDRKATNDTRLYWSIYFLKDI